MHDELRFAGWCIPDPLRSPHGQAKATLFADTIIEVSEIGENSFDGIADPVIISDHPVPADANIRHRRLGDASDDGRFRQQIRRSWFQHAARGMDRSEEHTSELQSLMRNSYAVFCLKQTK